MLHMGRSPPSADVHDKDVVALGFRDVTLLLSDVETLLEVTVANSVAVGEEMQDMTVRKWHKP